MQKILIVDDNAAARQLVRWSFNGEPFEVHEATNGDSGLKMALELQPDLLILDVQMPGGIDGYEVCRRLRADPRFGDKKIVILSGNNSPADQAEGARAGANTYLVKPFKPAAMLALTRHLLAGSKAQ